MSLSVSVMSGVTLSPIRQQIGLPFEILLANIVTDDVKELKAAVRNSQLKRSFFQSAKLKL
jgi:hypothetical protein